MDTASIFSNFCKYRYDFDPLKALKTGEIGEGDRLFLYSRILSVSEYIKKNGLNKAWIKGIEKLWNNLEGEYKSVFIKSLVIRKRDKKDLSILINLINSDSVDLCKHINEIMRLDSKEI